MANSGNTTKPKTKFSIYVIAATGAFLFSITYNGFLMQPKIDAAYISTVINGITASTSIVLGFGGVLLGLLYREIFKQDKLAKDFLLGIAFFFAIPIVYLYSVYFFLVTGSFDASIRTAFTGLIMASFTFILILLFTGYRISTKEEKKKQKLPKATS